MSPSKKIGLFTCIAVVAGNMMGSGIALLPASLTVVPKMSNASLRSNSSVLSIKSW